MAVERAFLACDVPKTVELLGTVAVDDRRPVVLLRELSTGEVRRVRSDLEAIRTGAPAETLERLVDEVLVETLHYQSFRTYRGTDRWGVHLRAHSPQDLDV